MRFWNRSGASSAETAIICTLLAPVLSGLAFIGCGTPPPANGRVEISYWEKWTGFEDDAMQAVVDDFNNSQNRIFVRKLTGIGEIERKLMLATAGGDPPDVAGVWPATIPGFSEKGALTPLDKMIQEAGIKRSDYIPVYWDLCSDHGFMWALPSTPWSVALHWNKKLFREAGLDPERPPRSLDELERMSERLTVVEIKRADKIVRVRYPDLTDAEKQAKQFRLVQVGHDPQQPGWWMPTWVYWFGGNLWDGQRHITADSPEMIQTFQWLRSQSEKYGIDNRRSFGASFGSFQSPQNPFFSDQIAMTLEGEWMYNFISKYAPQMEWGAAPFPAKDPAKYPLVTFVDADVLVIPKGAHHPREAFEFIRYVNEQGPMEKLCLGQRKFSPLAKVSDGFYQRHPNPYIKTFVELARSPGAQYAPRLSVWGAYNDEMYVAIDRIMALSATPQEALETVQSRMQRKLDRMLTRWDAVKEQRLKEWSDYDAR
jgi:ABC-type glycerol-3-phosphate transport system substrate-binding protein